jgi:hypothetical protein
MAAYNVDFMSPKEKLALIKGLILLLFLIIAQIF